MSSNLDFRQMAATYLQPFPYFECVVYSLIGIYLWESFLNLRQRAKLKETQPRKILTDLNLTTPEKFVTSQAYGLDKNTFALVQDVYQVIVEFGWLAYGFHYFWNDASTILKMVGYDDTYQITRSLVFFLLYTYVGTLLEIPFQVYKIFWLEEKHGFNKQTVSLYIVDTIKSLLISTILTSIILPIMLKIIDWGGDNFVFYLWLFLTVVIFILMWIAPSVIMPCFYKFDALKEDAAKPSTIGLPKAINDLADSLQFPLKKVYQMDGSKRSSHSNAFQYGFCGNKRIVLFDTLLDQASTREIVAILGHELGHWQFWHTLKGLVMREVQIFLMFALFSACYQDRKFFTDFGFEEPSNIIGLMLFVYLLSPINGVYAFVQNSVTRMWEFQADQFAVDLGYSKDIYSGLVKIHQENKSTLDPDWLYSAYHHSHPPLVERLTAISDYTKRRE